jgi:hypothetical protein
METNLTFPLLLAYLGISLIPWLIVMLAGGGFGYLLAVLFLRWFKGHQRAFDLMVLLPWRSIAIFIALVVINTPLMVWKFGIGLLSPSLSTGVALFVLFVPFIAHMLLNSWHPISAHGKVVSIVRTFAILSLALSVFLQTTGMGYFIYRASSELDFSKLILGYEVVGVMLLGADLLIGLIQNALTHSRTTKIPGFLLRMV